MGTSFRYAWVVGIVVILLGGLRGWCAEAPTYKTPDLKVVIFKGEVTVDKGERKKAATALAGLVRNELTLTGAKDYQNAARLLGVALHLDPENREAVVVNGELEDGREVKRNDRWSKDEALKQIRSLAKTAKESKGKGDPMVAAYLYASAAMASGNEEDTYQAQLLKQNGYGVDWYWADGTGVRGAREGETPTVQGVTKINGLVVMREPDGNWHGKVAEILATPGSAESHRKGTSGRLIGSVGHEMRVAVDEAFRLAEMRHGGASKSAIEISFAEKYSIKDGGSAGTAFTLLILSALGDFELNSDAAITGDLTVDGKVRSVGAVASKIHGAALDKCKVAVVPAADSSQIEDAILLQGPSALWEIQILSVETLDDAIAVMRKDRAEKLAQALALFDELKKSQAGNPVEGILSTPGAKEKLAKVLELAPNHVSAKYLQQLSEGKKPERLTLPTTLNEAFAALGLLRNGLDLFHSKAEFATDEGLGQARKNLARIQKMGDPAAAPVFTALHTFCQAYVTWANADREHDGGDKMKLNDQLRQRREEVAAAVAKVISDKEVIDRLLH